MRYDDYPTPLSDTESEGLPGTADDDTTAYDDVESGRGADGADPGLFPRDREESMAVDRFGNTAEEQRMGESLDFKIARESLETPDDDRMATSNLALADEAITEDAARQAPLDADVLDSDPVDPHLGSAVSMYDRPDPSGPVREQIGRLVGDDEGGPADQERDAVAHDAGAAGGGPSAEELAMHETPPPPLG